MTFEQITKKEKLYIKIAKQINDAIERKVYTPGQKLPTERELATQMGVSRPSVREALVALEIMNVIDIKVGDGSYVKEKAAATLEINYNSASELIEARILIEPIVSKLAVERATPDDINEMAETIRLMEINLDRPENVEQFFTSGVEFHRVLAKATKNDVMIQIAHSLLEKEIHPLWKHMNLQALSNKEARLHQIHEHQEILNAIREKDIEKVMRVMDEHIHHLKELIYD